MARIKLYFQAILVIFLLLPGALLAETTRWEMIPNESSIQFTATQNGSPVTGAFKAFTSEINFDPTQLTSSQVKIIVDIGSVSTSYKDIADTLKTSDWFDVIQFPKAIFKSEKFKKIGDNYEAEGTLTLRDKTLPINLKFTYTPLTSSKATVKGTATLKRNAFGVGKGEWEKTDQIKDDIIINFVIVANKK